MDAFYDTDPQVSPDGTLVVYTRRISGHDKIYVMPLDEPSRKTQLTFGDHDDTAPTSPRTAAASTTPPTEDDDIYNVRSLDLKTGAIRQYTDALGGNDGAGRAAGQGRASASPSSATSRASTGCRRSTPRSRSRRSSRRSADGRRGRPSTSSPTSCTRWSPENKRKKRTFEKLFLEGRPAAQRGRHLQRRLLRRQPGGALRRAGRPQLHGHRAVGARVPQLRGHVPQPLAPPALGLIAFDYTQFFYASPYNLIPTTRARAPSPPSATPARQLLAPVPARQVPPHRAPGGRRCTWTEGFENPAAEEHRAAAGGRRWACPSSSTAGSSRPSR